MLHSQAITFLKRADPKLAVVIRRIGPCRLKRRGGTFQLLARSILSQQISTAAAATIRRRLEQRMPNGRLCAQTIVDLPEDELAAAGVSAQKRGYLLDLAQRTVDGRANFRRLAQLPNENVIEELTAVRGIGVWTAQMFLLAGLGRPDIFAPDDLGLKNAIVKIYGLRNPDRDRLSTFSERWSPHRSVASWYLWQSLEG